VGEGDITLLETTDTRVVLWVLRDRGVETRFTRT